MNTKIIFIVLVGVVVGVLVVYLFLSKNGDLSFSLSPSSLNEDALVGHWILAKHLYWYPATDELKEMPLPDGSNRQYLEFRSGGQLCIGSLGADGRPVPSCDKSGSFQVVGETLTIQGGDFGGTNIQWEVKNEGLTMTIDVPRPADEPPLKIKNVFTKVETQAVLSSQQVEKNDKIPADWQTYQNPEYEFSIRYPAGYAYASEREPDEQHITFGPKQGGNGFPMRVTITEKSYDAAMAGFRKESGGKFQEQPRSVNGINGIEFIGEPDAQLSIIAVAIPHKSRALVFTGVAPNRTTLENELLPLFNLFISSFVAH